MSQSEVRRLMEQIDLATQAIERAMNEPAIVANHDAIIARYTNLGKVKDELAEHIGNKAATEAMTDSYEKNVG